MSTGESAAEFRKHSKNDPQCEELGWIDVPLVHCVVKAYGAYGALKHNTPVHVWAPDSLSEPTKPCPGCMVTDLYGHRIMALLRPVRVREPVPVDRDDLMSGLGPLLEPYGHIVQRQSLGRRYRGRAGNFGHSPSPSLMCVLAWFGGRGEGRGGVL